MNRMSRNVALVSLISALALIGCKKEEAAAGGEKAAAAAKAAVKKAAPATADAAVKALFDGLAKNDPGALWEFLPASYQKDVTGLVQGFAGQLDAEFYDKSMAVMAKAVKVLKEKKDFIKANEMFAQATKGAPLPPGAIDQNWDAAVGLLGAIAGSDLKTVAGLKGLDIGKFLSVTGGDLMKQGVAIAKATGQDPMAMLAGVKVEKGAAEGKVKISMPGQEGGKEEEFVQVEGKWIPAEMAKEWKGEIEKAKKQLGEVGPQMAQAKAMAMPMLTKVDGALDQLAGAKDQAAFDAALTGAMALMMGGAGQDGPPPDAPAEP